MTGGDAGRAGWSLRAYRSQDCAALLRLFYQTVHAVPERDYTRAQRDAWAPERQDAEAWNQSLCTHRTWVAVQEESIVGFGDVDAAGYLDRLYVHPDYQRRGIASALCDVLESYAKETVTTHASVTARPFFEKRGYRVLREQQVERQGVWLTNYVMQKSVN